MCIDEILDVIENLSKSQGFYGRLLARLEELKNEDVQSYQKVVQELEGQNFKDSVDLVLYFEC